MCLFVVKIILLRQWSFHNACSRAVFFNCCEFFLQSISWRWRVLMLSFPDANWFYSVVVSHLVVPFENFIGFRACSDGIGGCRFTVGCTRRWNHDGDWELFATHWKNSANKMSQKGVFVLIQVMRFAFSHYRGRCVGWRRALHFSVNEEFWSEDILPNRQGTKTQWIGWLNWGFRSWPLIRFVRTREWKSQSWKRQRDDGCAETVPMEMKSRTSKEVTACDGKGVKHFAIK